MTEWKPGTVPWIGLVLFSLILHCWALDHRAFHSDEAVHAMTAFKFLHEGSYRYDPTYHGPLLYFLTATAFGLIGDSDFSARLPAALSGVLMLLPAAHLRHWLGAGIAWWSGLLVTISPTLLYYGRFLNMDLLEVFTTTLSLLSLHDAMVRGHGRDWMLFGLWSGLAIATKENAYVTVFLLFSVWLAMQAWNGWKHLLPGCRAWIETHGAGLGFGLATTVVVVLILYTVFLRYPEDWSFPEKSIRYWAHQHAIERVSGPWWYYLPRLVLYEFLVIAAATLRILRGPANRIPGEIFLYLFGVASVVMYAYLGEKVPWLAVHQIWPFIPLAAAQLTDAFGMRGNLPKRVVATLALVVTFGFALRANFILEDIAPDRQQNEALIYVQTTPEFRGLALGWSGLEADPHGPAQAAVEGESTWPLAWYWRRAPVWWGKPTPEFRPPLVISDMAKISETMSILGAEYRHERIPIRAWWQMDAQWPSFQGLFRYVVTRATWSRIGVTEAVVLRKMDPKDDSVREAPTPRAIRANFPVDRTRIIGEGWLMAPRGIAVSNGRLALADPALSQVTVFAGSGALEVHTARELLREPEGLAWSVRGDLVVADTWKHRVVRLDPRTLQIRAHLVLADGWFGPRGVAVGADGTTAVTDTGHKRIVVTDPDFLRVRVLGKGGTEPGEFNEPVGLAWVGRNLLVADTGNRRLQLIDRQGQSLRVIPLPGAWADPYSRPQIAVILPDLWLITDAPAATIWVVRGQEVLALRLGEDGVRPAGIAWDASGNQLYVADLNGLCWEFRMRAGAPLTESRL